MKMKKKTNFNLKGFFNKKENMALFVVAVVFCVGIAVTNIKSNDIPLHDGDVLVDSQAACTDEQKEKEAEGEGSTKSFEEQKADMELERQELISKYDEIISNSESKSEKKNAQKQKEKLLSYMEQEVAIAGIIKTKDLPDCLIIITDNQITVTVDDKELNQSTVAKICNVVMEETKRSAENIIIQSNH